MGVGKKKTMYLWEFLIQVRYQIHLEKANELSNSSLLFSWPITYLQSDPWSLYPTQH